MSNKPAETATVRRRPLLGILLASGPDGDDLPVVLAAAQAALSEGAEVEVFAMDDGVHFVDEPRLAALIAAGVEVTVCAMDSEARGIDLPSAEARGVGIGDQSDHARLLRRCDRFLSFT
jgi:sulfur relay (sulfurtransferase) complex TusBCD TusD component (DsrE family)